MSQDLWERVKQLRQEAFDTPSVASRIDPRSSPSSADRLELQLWVAVDKCEQALERLVCELEKLMSVRQSAGRGNTSRDKA
jgi:hypothetical protein